MASTRCVVIDRLSDATTYLMQMMDMVKAGDRNFRTCCFIDNSVSK